MSKRMENKLFLGSVLAMLFSAFAPLVHAGPIYDTFNYNIPAIDTSFSGLFSLTNLYNLTVYYLAPFLLIFLVIYAFLEDANLFSSVKMNGGLALVMSLMAIPTGVMTRIVWFMTQFAVLGAITIFFGIFILYLSHVYRRKLVEYQYILNSKFLTMLLVHSPVIFFLILSGIAGADILYPTPAGYAWGIIIGTLLGLGWVGIAMLAHGKESAYMKAVVSGEEDTVKELYALQSLDDALKKRTTMSCSAFKKYLEMISKKKVIEDLGLNNIIKPLIDSRGRGAMCDSNDKLSSSAEITIQHLEDEVETKMKQLQDKIDAHTNLLLVGKANY